MTPLDALDRFAFARALSEGARARLQSHARLRMVAPRTPLLRRGEDSGGVFLVSHGAIRVYYLHDSGREGTLYWVEEKQACFLSLDCTVKDLAFPAWAEADDLPTQFVTIPAELFRELYATEAPLQRFVFDALSSRVFELMDLVEQSATLALEQRTAALLLRLADDEGRIEGSQDRIASHLGTAREVLSRIFRGWRAKALIETRRGLVRIRDPDALRALVEGA